MWRSPSRGECGGRLLSDVRGAEDERDWRADREWTRTAAQRRFEALHDPLSSPRRLMRILRPVVQALVLAMLHLQRHILAGRAIRGQLVRDHDARRPGCLSRQFAHEPAGGFPVATALNENVENKAVLIDGAPEPVFPAGDKNNGFVHVPFVAPLWGAAADAG